MKTLKSCAAKPRVVGQKLTYIVSGGALNSTHSLTSSKAGLPGGPKK